MARFILDVANLLPHQIKEVEDAVLNADIVHKSVATIYCIDETNENQFYADEDLENGKTNNLTDEQIKTFSEICDFKECKHSFIDVNNDGKEECRFWGITEY